ncbi:MAG: hypothetical protein J6T10_03785 [Methanobrevibacter sp.]|nr:hypothetical protein [Methanobrevibacter sp.]
MRQAINEYSGLKRQQQENAVRIYEAQNWVNYYNASPIQVQPLEMYSVKEELNQEVPYDYMRTAPTEQIPVIATATPGTLNNNVPSTLVENAIDTNTTMNVPVNPVFTKAQAQNTISATTPV